MTLLSLRKYTVAALLLLTFFTLGSTTAPLAGLTGGVYVAQAAQGDNTISSIVRLTGTTGTAASSTVTFSGGTQRDKMFHFCSFNYNVADTLHDQVFKATQITPTGALNFYAGQTAGSNLSLNYDCQIVIFTATSSLVVNRYEGAATAAAPTANNFTITAVSATSSAFVIPHGERDPSDTTIGGEETWEYRLTSASNAAE